MHEKFVSKSKRPDFDLYHHFGIPASVNNFDESSDSLVLQSWRIRAAGGLGGAAELNSSMESRYAALDQLEKASDRRMTPQAFLSFFTFARSLASSNKRKRKLVWDLFSVNGRMYPGRLLDLGFAVATAFKLSFGENELHVVEQLMRFTPRGHLSYLEWMSWSKMMSKTSPEKIDLFLNGFGLVNYYVKMVNRLSNASNSGSSSGRDFSCKARVNQDLFSSVIRVNKGLLSIFFFSFWM